MHRVSREDTTLYRDAAGEFFMAKSETEDAQLYITSEKQISAVTVDVGALANEAGDELGYTLLDEHYYDRVVFKSTLSGERFDSPIDDGAHGEALPRLRAPLDLQENESHAIVVQVATTASDASGWYAAPVTLKTADGTVVKEAILRVYVFNFTLDEKPAMETAIGFNFDKVYEQAAKEEAKNRAGSDAVDRSDVYAVMNEEAFREEYKPRIAEQYMQLFLDSRISPYHLPYSVTDPRADEIMSNPRLTTFCIDGGGNYHEALKSAMAEGGWITSDAKYISTYRKLAQNEEWLHKAYVYYVDEPSPYNVGLARQVKEHIDGVLDSTDDLKGLEWHQVVPMGGNDYFVDEFGIKTDENDYLYRYVDIMIPGTPSFTRYYTSAERKEFKKQYGYDPLNIPGIVCNWITADIWKLYPEQWQQRYDKYAEEGRRRWWYLCCAPEMPYPNFFTFYQGNVMRVLFWQQYLFHVEGFLYWTTQDQWDRTTLTDFPTNGDGVLLYWGEMWGQHEPVTSIRWEYIRDGIEDFQYFSQLERAGVGRDEVLSKYVNCVTTSILEYNDTDPYAYEDTRIEMGFALERLSAAD